MHTHIKIIRIISILVFVFSEVAIIAVLFSLVLNGSKEIIIYLRLNTLYVFRPYS